MQKQDWCAFAGRMCVEIKAAHRQRERVVVQSRHVER